MAQYKARTVTLNIAVIDRIEEQAEKENRTFSNMIDTILKNYIETNSDDYVLSYNGWVKPNK